MSLDLARTGSHLARLSPTVLSFTEFYKVLLTSCGSTFLDSSKSRRSKLVFRLMRIQHVLITGYLAKARVFDLVTNIWIMTRPKTEKVI